jgi:hypothetical protein
VTCRNQQPRIWCQCTDDDLIKVLVSNSIIAQSPSEQSESQSESHSYYVAYSDELWYSFSAVIYSGKL